MAKKSSQSTKNEIPEEIGFEESVEELESIVRRLEQGGGPLEEALEDYAKAINLLKSCHKRLDLAEKKVQVLSGFDAQGNPVTKPFDSKSLDADPQDLGAKQAARATRRSAPSNPRGTDAELF